MKTLIALFSFVVFSSNFVSAGEDPNLVRELRNKLSVDLSRVELSPWQKDYVKVCFRIENGEIEIVAIKGSLRELESILRDELQKIHVESPYEEGKTYEYRFTFEKI